MGIGVKTRKLLWGKSGNRCAMCKIVLYENEVDTDNSALIGEECHIVAKEIKGPRGESSLTDDERDMEDNLILLCCNDHTVIDSEIDKFTVDKLKKIKIEHESWVRDTLNTDIDKALLSICTTIEKIEKNLDFKNWTQNFSGITYNPNCVISKQYYDRLVEVNDYIFKRFKIQQYSIIEDEIDNFRNILHDYLKVFFKYIDWENNESIFYITERFYKIDEWNPERYALLSEKYDFHIKLINDLIIELTRSANRIIELIRKKIDISYMQDNGKLMLHFGPDMNMMEYKFTPEYNEHEKYSSLIIFCTERKNRQTPIFDGTDKFVDDYL